MSTRIDDDRADQLIQALWSGPSRNSLDVPASCWYTVSTAVTLLALLVLLLLCLASPFEAEGQSLQRGVDPAWLAAFEIDHGFLPWEDPCLLDLGMTADQALVEHLSALEWSLSLGHTPDMAEWEARWRQVLTRRVVSERWETIIGESVWVVE